MYQVIFEDSSGKERLIGTAYDEKGYTEIVQEFLEEHNYKSYYTIMRNSETGDIVLDVGSHTEFFIIRRVRCGDED